MPLLKLPEITDEFIDVSLTFVLASVLVWKALLQVVTNVTKKQLHKMGITKQSVVSSVCYLMYGSLHGILQGTAGAFGIMYRESMTNVTYAHLVVFLMFSHASLYLQDWQNKAFFGALFYVHHICSMTFIFYFYKTGCGQRWGEILLRATLMNLTLPVYNYQCLTMLFRKKREFNYPRKLFIVVSFALLRNVNLIDIIFQLQSGSVIYWVGWIFVVQQISFTLFGVRSILQDMLYPSRPVAPKEGTDIDYGHTGVAIPIAFPDSRLNWSGHWYNPVLRILGFIDKEGNLKTGHIAVVLVSRKECLLFELKKIKGAPEGSIRCARKRPEQKMSTIPKFNKGGLLINPDEIVEEARENLYRSGKRFCFATTGIDFESAASFANRMVDRGKLPYSGFLPYHHNCVSFVQDCLLAGNTNFPCVLRMLWCKYTWPTVCQFVKSVH